MQTSFAANMLALVDGVPALLTCRRRVARLRRPPDRRRAPAAPSSACARPEDREHIVEGLVKALDMIDAIIALIRGAADVETARSGLMAEPFEFSEIQANYILDMQLRRLTQLEGKKLRDELAELQATIKELESILDAKAKLRGVIKTELTEMRDKFGDERRTQHHGRHRRDRRPRPHRGRRGRRRPHEQGLHQDRRRRRVPPAGPRRPRRARSGNRATTTTSITCSPPPRTRTCCSSPTAAGCTASAPTRSR